MGTYHLFANDGSLYQLLYIGVSLLIGGLFVYFGSYYPNLLTPPYDIVEETRITTQGQKVQQRKIVFE